MWVFVMAMVLWLIDMSVVQFFNKRKLLAICGLLVCGATHAQWTHVMDDIYLDFPKIRQINNNTFQAWMLANTKTPGSSMFLAEFDCQKKRVSMIRVVIFAKPMGTGDVLRSGTYSDWGSIISDSPLDAVSTALCRKTRITH